MVALLALLACGDKPNDSGDSEAPPTDEDGDGYLSDVDCDGLTSDSESVDATTWYLDAIPTAGGTRTSRGPAASSPICTWSRRATATTGTPG
jgi:hypothetical protein